MRGLGLLTFMIPIGFSISCGILLGNSIGAGSIIEIQFYYKLSMGLSIFAAIFQNTILFVLEDLLIAAFTDIKVI